MYSGNPGYGGGQQGYNQGYNQGGYNQGGYNQGGYNQGGYNQGGYNQGGYNQGGYNQGGYNQGGYNQEEYQPSQYSQGYNRPPGPPPPQEQSYGTTQSTYQQNPSSQIEYDEPTYAQAPSTAPQSFGVDGYNYKYSDCSGNRKALLIGINYFGSKNELRGCINDVQKVKKFLLESGFYEGDMVILTDDQEQQVKLPTRANIIRAIEWLVADAQPNDSLFFHYSGHGSQVEDQDGDEEDGIDETIVPLDFEDAGQIVDDDLHTLMVKPLQAGVRLTALFDSCHSGSVLDLPYCYSTKGVLKEPDLLEEMGGGLLETAQSYFKGDTSSALKSLQGLVKMAVSSGSSEKAYEKSKQTKTSPADVVMFSGSKDNQTSADATEGGIPTGAMSYSFIEVMSKTRQQTYLSLLQNMRKILEDKYSQKPQFSASHPIDVNLQFLI